MSATGVTVVVTISLPPGASTATSSPATATTTASTAVIGRRAPPPSFPHHSPLVALNPQEPGKAA